MNGLTWAGLAEEYIVRWCAGCDEYSFDHRGGDFDPRFDQRWIHWTDRRMNRMGLRRFLALVWDLDAYFLRFKHPMWWFVWRRNVFAYREALRHGVRLPASVFEEDRLRVTALIVGSRPHPDKEKARRWANGSRSAAAAPSTTERS